VRQEISNKASDMRTASLDEAADLLREIAGNRRADESLKALFRRLQRKLADWSDNRIRDVWHRDPRVSVRSVEIEQLRSLAKRRDQDKADGDALDELRQRISRLEALLERIDPTFHRPQIDALRSQRREVG
jgi:Lon protease-like protein